MSTKSCALAASGEISREDVDEYIYGHTFLLVGDIHVNASLKILL